MKSVRNEGGVIVNAAVLKASHVAQKRVLCPACGEKVFEKWPGGWDAHAANKCRGISSKTPARRKEEYKSVLFHLFR